MADQNRERQAAELTLLSTMYPSEFSWRSNPPPDLEQPNFSDPEFALVMHPSYILEFTLPISYPSESKPSVYLTCGSDVGTSRRKEARNALNMILDEQEVGMEILDLIVTAFVDLLPELLVESKKNSLDLDRNDHGQNEGPGMRNSPKRIKRVVIWSHHLLATGKRRDIQSWSRELSLGGYSRPGYPGAVFAEGEEDQIDEFVRRLKQLRWQALQVRAEEVVSTRICGAGDGVNEVEGLGEIAEALKEKDAECAKMFLDGMKIAGSSH